MVGDIGQHREGSQAERCDLGQKPQQPDPVGTVGCTYASWPEAGGLDFLPVSASGWRLWQQGVGKFLASKLPASAGKPPAAQGQSSQKGP